MARIQKPTQHPSRSTFEATLIKRLERSNPHTAMLTVHTDGCAFYRQR
jgi:hypothetical protein